jgi:hypothetical protein
MVDYFVGMLLNCKARSLVWEASFFVIEGGILFNVE